ncbi:enoyl-CoA hydratase/isomerase family protein [Haladaptatus sp. ZSTT2]|uniref:enoyl-CoA hydratase/isomerase family protein n=1 Tax=Haladaptatus sp. ZSTT2 TaxID=3120515 RepID=UPI00300F33E6
MTSDGPAAQFTDIVFTTDGNVAEIVLDRPEKGNTLRPETIDEIDAAREYAEDTDGINALVIRSTGDRFFSTGADLNSVLPLIEEDDSDGVSEFNANWHAAYRRIEQSAIPIIAGVSGMALAGGFELLLVCDLVVAAPSARFGDHHVKYNLIGGGGSTQRLPRLVGLRRAKELLLTEKMISAETAREWGLVNEVIGEDDDLAEATMALAKDVASHHPLALRRQKHLANQSVEMALEPSLKLEQEMANVHLLSSAAQEGLAEFMDRE